MSTEEHNISDQRGFLAPKMSWKLANLDTMATKILKISSEKNSKFATKSIKQKHWNGHDA